jgi:hypothetical protein
VEQSQKYHTGGKSQNTTLVEQSQKYHTGETIPKIKSINCRSKGTIDTVKTHTHDLSLSWHFRSEPDLSVG